MAIFLFLLGVTSCQSEDIAEEQTLYEFTAGDGDNSPNDDREAGDGDNSPTDDREAGDGDNSPTDDREAGDGDNSPTDDREQ